ncbi:C-type lectin 37Db-like [Anopheles stephensi]|uniref:C-type lectin 37Db-like n=1 Tax=Anopheles stephensi TaxID=30069 RepID=UPI001658B06A|nr:C-type lectin 37Db-like [Anopheles stephensi]
MAFKQIGTKSSFVLFFLITWLSVASSNISGANNVDDVLRQNGCLCPCKPSEEKEYYIPIRRTSNWYGAVAFCNSVGMEIAEVLNEDEASALRQVLQEEESDLDMEFFWIGANDLGTLGTHRWGLSGRPVTYSNWTEGEPNHALSDDGQTERCVAIAKDTFVWNDFQCTGRKKFVCQQFRDE